MAKNGLILLIEENPANGDDLRQVLASSEARFRVQSVERVATALARIAGGGVDLVILDLSRSKKPEIEGLDSFLQLRSNAPDVPLVVLSDSEDDTLVIRAVKAAAADYLPRARCRTDLGFLVRSAIGRRTVQLEPRLQLVPESRKAGSLIAFLGAKGGVGATTVALGVASALARWGTVILAELRPMYGTLSPYFHPRHLAGNIAHLLQADAGNIDLAAIENCLWPYKNIPGLRILFGPQTIKECGEVPPHSAKAILQTLSGLADYVLVDLPASLSEANRTAVQECGSLLLVVERDPLCVESAKQILETVHAWNADPPLMESVIVNRAALGTPMDLAEIEKLLGIPTAGVIPPAADLCIAAQKAGMPLPLFDPDSIVARSMISLAEGLSAPRWKPARAS